MYNHRLALTLIAGIVLFAASMAAPHSSKALQNQEPKPAPQFKLKTIEGKELSLASLKGKVVVLNFWFIGCPPCVSEMPELNRLVKDFMGDPVVFIALAIDKKEELEPFLSKNPFNFHIAPDAGELILNQFGDGSGDLAFPAHLVIDREGRIVYRSVGGLIGPKGETVGLEALKAKIKESLPRLGKPIP